MSFKVVNLWIKRPVHAVTGGNYRLPPPPPPTPNKLSCGVGSTLYSIRWKKTVTIFKVSQWGRIKSKYDDLYYIMNHSHPNITWYPCYSSSTAKVSSENIRYCMNCRVQGQEGIRSSEPLHSSQPNMIWWRCIIVSQYQANVKVTVRVYIPP